MSQDHETVVSWQTDHLNLLVPSLDIIDHVILNVASHPIMPNGSKWYGGSVCRTFPNHTKSLLSGSLWISLVTISMGVSLQPREPPWDLKGDPKGDTPGDDWRPGSACSLASL